MSWRDKTVIRILLIVAKLIARDQAIVTEIERLAAHISVNSPKPDADHPEAFIG